MTKAVIKSLFAIAVIVTCGVIALNSGGEKSFAWFVAGGSVTLILRELE